METKRKSVSYRQHYDTKFTSGELQRTEWDWCLKSEPQTESCLGLLNNSSLWPRGKCLGGSSCLNYMAWVRGNRKDFEKWVELGAKGWSYDELLPYFMRCERCRFPTSPENSRGTEGSVSIEIPKKPRRVTELFLQTLERLGIRRSEDYNGRSQMGCNLFQVRFFFFYSDAQLNNSCAYINCE